MQIHYLYETCIAKLNWDSTICNNIHSYIVFLENECGSSIQVKLKQVKEVKKKILEAASYNSFCNTTPLSFTWSNFKMSKTSTKIVISSGFSDICVLNGSSPGLQPVQTCKTEEFIITIKNRHLNMHYIMTKQRQYLQIVNKHGLLTTEGHLILHRKRKVGIKIHKQLAKPPTAGSSQSSYKPGNFYTVLNMQAHIFSTRCQITYNFGFI